MFCTQILILVYRQTIFNFQSESIILRAGCLIPASCFMDNVGCLVNLTLDCPLNLTKLSCFILNLFTTKSLLIDLLSLIHTWCANFGQPVYCPFAQVI